MTTLAPPPGIHFGPDGFPDERHSLGWQALEWCAEYLQIPDGPQAGEPWMFTPEQARFVLWWYAIDERGRFVYNYAMLRRMKGWGKDPVGAAICALEFVGPSRFDGFAPDGRPRTKPVIPSWVQIAAVSREQTKTTMTLFGSLFTDKLKNDYGVDLGKELIYARGGTCRLESVTSSPATLEGARSTFVLKNETHHWIAATAGPEMAAVVARNLAKSRDGSARALAISNAHNPGEGSDAEEDWETYRKIRDGLADADDFLYDSVEAPPVPDLGDEDAVRAGLLAARGDSYWLDVERLSKEIRNPKTKPTMARRFYLNQIVAEEDKPFRRETWAALTRAGYQVPAGALITLGFDGSINRDWTACIATEVASGYQWPVGIWEPRLNQVGLREIPLADVGAGIEFAFERWQVWRFYGDPFYWTEQMAAWAGRYGDDVIVEWRTTNLRKMAFALLAYQNAIDAGEVAHDGNALFAAAMGNAVKQMHSFTDDLGEPMWTIQKERPDSPFKIDPAIAGCLSWQARLDAIAAGVLDQGEVGVFWA